MPHRIDYGRQARIDLQAVTDWLTLEAGPAFAHAYVDLIRSRCDSLIDFPRRGQLRRRAPNVRSILFKRAVTILNHVGRREVRILRVLHSGRDIERDVATLA